MLLLLNGLFRPKQTSSLRHTSETLVESSAQHEPAVLVPGECRDMHLTHSLSCGATVKSEFHLLIWNTINHSFMLWDFITAFGTLHCWA